MTTDPCDALIERYVEDGSNAHYALLFTPYEQRTRAAAVMSFAGQMRALTTVNRDIAPAKIHWWHEELQRLKNGAARHPVTTALGPTADDALLDALNDLLHGAVMDFNTAEIAAADLAHYLHLRSGAVLTALAAAGGHAASQSDCAPAAAVIGVAQILSDARDPACSERPAAQLVPAAAPDGAADKTSNERIEHWLRGVYADHAQRANATSSASITGAIYLALYKQAWPSIIATPFGHAPKSPSPVRKLWCAWRAARNFKL